MKKFKLKSVCALLLCAVMLFSLAACIPGNLSGLFDEFLRQSFVSLVSADTLSMHFNLADPEAYGVTRPEPTLGEFDFSEKTIEEDKKAGKEALEMLDIFDFDSLNSEQKFTFDILKDYSRLSNQSYDYLYYIEPFAYTSGIHANLPILLSEYVFYNKQDVEDYMGLLGQIKDYFQNFLSFERVKADKGMFMPKACAEEVIRQCSEFIENPDSNLITDTFDDRIKAAEGLTDEEIEGYIKQNRDLVKDNVIPAYENVIRVFEELKDKGVNQLGLAHFEDGKEYYAYMLKLNVGTDKTPEEVISLLDTTINKVSLKLSEIVRRHADEIEDYYEDMEDFYADLEPRDTILYLKEALSDRFPEMPEIDFTISPVHESMENITSPAFYLTPPIDSYRNNVIHTNMDSESNGHAAISLLAHEGIPGHMFQNTYFLSQEPYPIRAVLNFSGYSEGWATYVEMMAYDYYDYSNPIYADLERLQGQLSLLVSARMEIGVNYEGWDLAELAEYLDDNGYNSEVAEDMMRYVIAEPVNYQTYCVGWLEFEELRRLAEDELGRSFNEREFHEAVLNAGPCQFYLLRDKVEDYIGFVQFREDFSLPLDAPENAA